METITFYEFLRSCLQREAEQMPVPAALREALSAMRKTEDKKAAAPAKPPRSRGP